MVLVEFSMTTAASEEMSEAWGHPEMELVDMVLTVSAAVWSVLKIKVSATNGYRDTDLLKLYHILYFSCKNKKYELQHILYPATNMIQL